MSGEKLSLTPEQDAAVKYRGGGLLVSAAAGSGKTKVLVERLLGRVMDGDGDIDRFLVITYTRAAASELREKILDEISQKLAREPDNRRLRRQSVLCHGAPISTIHSFCTDILRESPQSVKDLTPDFRVADESESAMIKSAVLEDVLSGAYEEIGSQPDFRQLVDTMSAGRDDSRLVQTILDTHAKLQSSPDPERWSAEQVLRLTFDGASDACNTVWGVYLMENVRRAANFWLGEMSAAREEMRCLVELDKAYGASFDTTISSLDAFIGALDRSWDEAQRCARIDFPRAKGIAGYEEFKELRQRCKAAMEKLETVFECTSAELFEDMAAVAPAITGLMRLILVFDRAYAAEKRRKGLVDFSDLEHLTLSLLIDCETGEKTELARAVSGRFEEIMVDEYQDVNAVQEMIFNAVSREGANVFMVGDVKQSIYRFRLADPSIFLEKYKAFADAGTDGCERGARILLSKNFRSRAGVLDAVNFVFQNIMSQEFGEMDYTEREYLYPGRVDAGDEGEPALELDIVDMSGIERGEDEDSPEKVQVEARFVAERIAELVRDGEIPDGAGGSRRVEYGDIVILLRSVRDKAWRYASALTEKGIPADMPGGEGFLESVEVSAALSLLSVIDNSMQDIPLASALRSPVYGFTADELAAVRASSRDTDFYGALVKAAETDEKCAAFLSDLDGFRAVAPDLPADRFIWHVYNKTGMLASFGAMRGGVRRRENLILLADYARRFETSGYKGLFGFLMYIRSLQERGEDLNPGEGAVMQNAVRIMSIHKSKGLEFPVVILADTSKKLNNKDAVKPLVVHPLLGAGVSRTDRVRRIEYTTLSRLAVQKKLTSEMMAEELRVLYVAMTRAREKLIITAAFKDAGRELEKLGKAARLRIPPQVLEETRSMAGWMLLPALTRPEATYLLDGSEKPPHRAGDWDIRLVRAEKQQTGRQEAASAAADTADALTEDTHWLRERFAFVYPYLRASELPSKLTVTELKGRYTDFEAAEDGAALDAAAPEGAGDGKKRRFAYERPDFITQKTALTATERGTALHLAMQYIDFARCGSIDGVVGEIERLVQYRLIRKEQAEAIDPHKITGFFESDIGKCVLGAENVYREFKFSMLRPASYFFEDGGDDEILLQGVVDCYFEEDGGLTVVDFKTDRVTELTLAGKVKQYAPQLHAYSDALERMTEMRVRRRVIYFFDADRAVGV